MSSVVVAAALGCCAAEQSAAAAASDCYCTAATELATVHPKFAKAFSVSFHDSFVFSCGGVTASAELQLRLLHMTDHKPLETHLRRGKYSSRPGTRTVDRRGT